MRQILRFLSDRRARFGTLALLSSLLSGCFVSEQPKFPLSSAAAAFGEGGRYATLVREGGTFKPDSIMELRHRADGGYDMIDEKGVTAPISLHAIANGYYVAQGKTEENRNSYHYVVIKPARGGAEALLYAPECKAQDTATLATFGVEVHDEECVLDHVADPAGLFAVLSLGKPTSKMVRQ
ncbi:MAG TPA: hypothetical protein VG985_00865 [Xanthobacteraceae bacterium]|nr:hypothetical protein [Xanthobacteraceae bacterium]